VVEVLSDSTAAFDRGGKFRDYRTLESLRYYLLVDQYQPTVECYERGADDSWTLRAYADLAATVPLTLGGVTLSLPLARVYRRVAFAEETPAPDRDALNS
jgi:Uma2 family endonuclease